MKDEMQTLDMMTCRHLEVQEDEEVEEFQVIEKLQQFGVNQGEASLLWTPSAPGTFQFF
jgi:hypothetical protein